MPKRHDVREDGFIFDGFVWRSPEGIARKKVATRNYMRKYAAPATNFTGKDTGKATAACELFVRADLSRRGFEVTVPVSPTATHDLHVELPSVGWRGVQVKAAIRNTRTGHIRSSNGRPTKTSPILALVLLHDNRIVYQAGTEPLPRELE